MVVLGLLLSTCHFYSSSEELARAFRPEGAAPIPWEEHRIAWKPGEMGAAVSDQADQNHKAHGVSLPLRYIATGKPDGPILLFVHGSPGELGGWLDYLKDKTLRRNFALLALDRPGYGESARGRANGSLSWQARALLSVLQDFKKKHPASDESHRRVVLLGHSLGGPIVLRFAIDFPGKASALVLLASPADPKQEEWAWFNRLAEYWAVQLFLPQDWITSNRELKPLREELSRMQTHFGDIRCPVLLIHGREDGLVPVANAAFLKQHLIHASGSLYYTPKSEDHFVIWSRRPWVTQRIVDFLQRAALAGRSPH